MAAATTFQEAKNRTAERIALVFDYDRFAQGRDLGPTAAAEAVWQLLCGHLRGKIPYPVPEDLDGVAFGAALRYLGLLEEADKIRLNDNASVAPGTYRNFAGFLLPEVTVLNRYRVRTA